MKVIINDTTFQDAKWNVSNGIGTLIIETDESIAEVMDAIGVGNNIQVYNDNALVATWFNSGVKGVSCDVGEKTVWVMAIRFSVSILDNNVEAELQEGVNDSVDAIIELAKLIDSMDESVSENTEAVDKIEKDMVDVKDTISDHSRDISGAKDDIRKSQDDIGELKHDMATVKSSVEAIAPMQKSITDAQKDVTDLKNEFISIPKDIPNQFTLVWNAYNALSDRVATLENKEVE